MNKRNGLIFILTVIFLTASYLYLSSSYPKTSESNPEAATNQAAALTFSNTQSWDVQPLALPDGATAIPFSAVTLPPPPANTSTSTQRELEYLHSLVAQRSSSTVATITAEIAYDTIEFNGTELGALWRQKPHTTAAFRYLLAVTEPAILDAKRHFDRVRPSLLDPSLPTAITVPKHPAYPSGHATQAYLLAHFFSALDPTNQDQYYADALRVAHNREIAGVHYPSDSQAGRILARQLYNILKSDSAFLQLFETAKTEW